MMIFEFLSLNRLSAHSFFEETEKWEIGGSVGHKFEDVFLSSYSLVFMLDMVTASVYGSG